MKKAWTIIFSALVLCACNNASEEPDVPAPNPPSPEKPVVLSKPISEDFSGKMSSLVECKTLVVRDDFRYFPEFPSFTERNKKVMLLRIDLIDAAGINRGPSISSKDKCHYGTYSVNFRAPKTIDAQPDLGACVGLTLTDDDRQVALEVRLSDPDALYLVFGDEEFVVRPEGFHAYSQFYTFGIDWSLVDVVWWMKTSENGKKIVLKDMLNTTFRNPATFSFNYYFSKIKPVENKPLSVQAPYYAYEVELSTMDYAPENQ